MASLTGVGITKRELNAEQGNGKYDIIFSAAAKAFHIQSKIPVDINLFNEMQPNTTVKLDLYCTPTEIQPRKLNEGKDNKKDFQYGKHILDGMMTKLI